MNIKKRTLKVSYSCASSGFLCVSWSPAVVRECFETSEWAEVWQGGCTSTPAQLKMFELVMMLSFTDSAVAPQLWCSGYPNYLFISSHRGTKKQESGGEDSDAERKCISLLCLLHGLVCPQGHLVTICQGTSCGSGSPKTFLFFCFALLFKELLFQDEAKWKAGCIIDCVLFLFPFLSLPVSSLAIYSPLTSGAKSILAETHNWFYQSSSDTQVLGYLAEFFFFF